MSAIGADCFEAIWGCVFEDFLSRDDKAGRNIVDDYLQRRGWKESVAEKAYMAALRTAAMSLYEVSEVAVGKSFLARDLIRGGGAVLVQERSATRQLKQWDRIAARILNVSSKNIMCGGVLGFDYEPSEALLKQIRRTLNRKRKKPINGKPTSGHMPANASADTRELRALAPTFTQVWLSDALKRMLGPQRPEVRNSEDDELVFTIVHYALLPGTTTSAVHAALRQLSALRQEGDSFWNWLDHPPPAPPKRSYESRPRQRFVTSMEDGSLVLGTLELGNTALTLSVNSRERAKRGRALLAPVLSELVRTPLVEMQTIEQLMAERPVKDEVSSSSLPPEDELAIVQSLMDRH